MSAYRHLGWASARLDDAAGFIPARLTWLLIALAAASGRARSGGASDRLAGRREHPEPERRLG